MGYLAFMAQCAPVNILRECAPPGRNSAVWRKMCGKSLKLANFNRIFTLTSDFF